MSSVFIPSTTSLLPWSLDVPGAPAGPRLPALPHLRCVPHGPQVHGLRLVLRGVQLGGRVQRALEERVVPSSDNRGEPG